MIHHAKLDSSVIASIAHDSEHSLLDVRLVSGACYRYSGVDVKTFSEFLTADSPGQFYNHHIKGHFDSIKIEVQP